MTRRALITGITGQDGSYLAESLLAKGYEVHGLVRRTSTPGTSRIDHLRSSPRLVLHAGDLTDSGSLRAALERSRPDEVYNLAAQSHVGESFQVPVYTADVVGLGVLRLLDEIRSLGLPARVYQASSSELYGRVVETPQRETTPFHPRSPYACAKAFAFHVARNHREAWGMHVSNGILFNHESERRGETFVTRKITRAVGRIRHGLQDRLVLGNLDARRDWGHAADYVEAMWAMLQQPAGDDYVIATGESHSVREFCELAFAEAGLDWRDHVDTDPALLRPAEVDEVVGDASKARERLGWAPKIPFPELVRRMVAADLRLAEREHALRD